VSLFGPGPVSFLESALDAASLRQKVLANNIANIDTPNFKRSDVSFADQLRAVLSGDEPALQGLRDDPRQIPIGPAGWDTLRPVVYTDTSTALSNNGNNVDIDAEMGRIAANELEYQTLVEELNLQFKNLQTAIDGGK
jgi:flagellar basal-body rod protein FlgB